MIGSRSMRRLPRRTGLRLVLLGLVLVLGAGVADAASGEAPGVDPFLQNRGGMPEFRKIMNYKPALVTTVYAGDGRILGYLSKEKRFLEPLSAMPKHLLLAFLAAEDNAFYEHEGIDLTAIFRAMSKNLQSGDIVQGASTITQQIVKRLLLTSEKSYGRKFKEAVLAYRLERHFGKNEIFSIYLNDIFFGANAYGVEAAARTFFAKRVGELTLAESAVLAGLPKAPTKYNPFHFPDEAKARQKYVLNRLLALEWISEADYKQAMDEPLAYKSMPDPSWTLGAYYLEEVRRFLIDYLSEDNMRRLGKRLDRYGEDAVYASGLHVRTAIDLDHQAAAEKALRAGLEESSKRRGWKGPIKRLEPKEYDAFLHAEPLPARGLVPDAWVRVLVTRVTGKGAEVKLPNGPGFIDVATMKWCRAPNLKLAPENAGSVTDATRVLKPGDVVWARVLTAAAAKSAGAAGKAAPPVSLALEQWPDVQGALVSLEPPTGDVVALVGGYDFAASQFNRATQASRQPGSSFKPIVYSAALDNGFTAASVVLDEPVEYVVDRRTNKTWRPKNYSGQYYGPTTLLDALVNSRNLVTVRVADGMGIGKVVERAKTLGLTPHFPAYLSVALGSVAVSPINLCQAYTAFARDGTWVKPRLVLSVNDAYGEELYAAKPEAKQGVTPQNAFVMALMLKEVVQRGTGYQAKALKRPVAGKTGTTNEEQDAWFIGFSPYLLTGVYVGFDQVAPMGTLETGSRAAAPIWVKYRQVVEDRYPVEDFKDPGGIVFAKLGGPESVGPQVPFIAGTEPTFFSDELRSSPEDLNRNLGEEDRVFLDRPRARIPDSGRSRDYEDQAGDYLFKQW